MPVGHFHDQSAGGPHFPMQKPDRVLFVIVGTERVRTHHFGIVTGFMGEGFNFGPHLVQYDLYAAFSGLPGGLRAREPAANDVKRFVHGGDVEAQTRFEKASLGLCDVEIFAEGLIVQRDDRGVGRS